MKLKEIPSYNFIAARLACTIVPNCVIRDTRQCSWWWTSNSFETCRARKKVRIKIIYKELCVSLVIYTLQYDAPYIQRQIIQSPFFFPFCYRRSLYPSLFRCLTTSLFIVPSLRGTLLASVITLFTAKYSTSSLATCPSYDGRQNIHVLLHWNTF